MVRLDYLGRDMLSRILMGARYTVGISLAAVCLACSAGALLGMTAAVTGGWFDMALSRFLDALNSIPSKLSGLVMVAAVGSSIPVLILVLAVIYTPGSYRFARALAVNIDTMDYVIVARARGERTPYLRGPAYDYNVKELRAQKSELARHAERTHEQFVARWKRSKPTAPPGAGSPKSRTRNELSDIIGL